MRRVLCIALLMVAPSAFAQIIDHTLTICAEDDNRTGFIPGWKLIGVVAYNPGGDLFTPIGVGTNVSTGTVVTERADLGVTTSITPSRVPAGQTALYVANVSNSGPQGATGVNLTVNLANGLTVQSAEPTQGTCATSGNIVTCGMGALALGAQARLNLNVVAGNDARGTLTTTANVSALQSDPNPSNNQASTAMDVDAPPPQNADVAITKRATPTTARPGDRVTYDMDVRNIGPATATNVRITDTMPSGISVTSASSTQGTCTNTASAATCNAGSLAVGGEMRMTVVGTVGDTAQRSSINTATVAADQPDPVSTNNTSSVTITVEPPANTADVQVTKTDSADPVAPGAVIRYTMRITNAGPAGATEVILTDTLPPGSQFRNCSPTCVPGDVVVECFFRTLAAGATVVAFVDIAVPTTAGTITNRASVRADQPDNNPGNNTASETTTVRP